ncbi:hypothetical protein [Streptomyces sp. NPDC088178]|uniref:hypothetical protein n=1 Tax=Streptomyces sp. NPDC088178 TaxID=3365836 RepID=UPI0038244B11
MPTNRDLRTQLAAASNRLREVDSANLAEAVDRLLVPRGWVALRDSDPNGASGPNLAIMMDAADRYRIVDGADNDDTTVTEVVNDGFRKVIAGEYTPRKPSRAPYGSAKSKVNLNVTPVLSMRTRVEEVTGMLASHVAADYLMHKYKAGPYADDYAGDPLAPGPRRGLQVPIWVRDLIQARAKAAGRKVTDDANEGFQKYLAGEFAPEIPKWPNTSDTASLRMAPNADLYEQVLAAGEPRPLQVAVAYLLAKYDIDPGATK